LGTVTGSREIGETIGYQLRRLRRLRGLTQEELADRANVSRDLVAKLEQGRRQTARITSLVSLACALDVELSALVKRAGDGPAIRERATTMTAACGLAKGEQGHPEIDDMDRRELLRLLSIAGASTAALGAGVDWDRLDDAARTTCLDAATADEYAALNAQLWHIFAGSVAGDANVVTELAASVAGNDPGPLATVQTTHHVDMAVAALADHRAISYLRRWLDDGHDSVLRVNAAGILAKLPGQGDASRVADALSRDGEVRDRYMTAVVARVCDVDWPTASGLIQEPSMFPRPALVAGRFAHEAVSSRDAGARWCSAAMLQALSPMIGRSSSWS
jgi:transcriptional regulator with XRE-family HTH domain